MRGDLMERLAAADPLVEQPTLTEVEAGERDALLARLVVTPAEPEVRRRRLGWALRAAPRPIVAAALACLLVVSGLALDLLESDQEGPSVLDKAIAATTQGGVIYHVVSISNSRRESADPRALEAFEALDAVLGANSSRSRRLFGESWVGPKSRSRNLVHVAEGDRRGRLLMEQTVGPSGVRQYYGDLDRVMVSRPRPGPPRRLPTRKPSRADLERLEAMPPDVDPANDLGAQLRELAEQGRLRVTGETELDGRRSYRLDSGLWVDDRQRGHTERVMFLVDAETYLPLEHRRVSTQRAITAIPPNMLPEKESWDALVISTNVTRYLVYERLEPTPGNLRKLRFGRHPGADVLDSGNAPQR
jgi:hypothetical protein